MILLKNAYSNYVERLEKLCQNFSEAFMSLSVKYGLSVRLSSDPLSRAFSVVFLVAEDLRTPYRSAKKPKTYIWACSLVR